MKTENINYVKQLGIIADENQRAADIFGEVSGTKPLDIESLKTNFNAYERAYDIYKRCKQSLSQVNPPAIINKEHAELVDAYQLFIDSVEIMLSAIDLNKGTHDDELFKQGFEMRVNAVFMAESIGDKVVKKFTNN